MGGCESGVEAGCAVGLSLASVIVAQEVNISASRANSNSNCSGFFTKSFLTLVYFVIYRRLFWGGYGQCFTIVLGIVNQECKQLLKSGKSDAFTGL